MNRTKAYLRKVRVPNNYLMIRHAEKDVWDKYALTAVAGVVLIGAILLKPEALSDTQASKSFIFDCANFFLTISGFFLAMLTAVSTFGDKGVRLDDTIPDFSFDLLDEGYTPGGEKVQTPATRRRLLAYMFGFLSYQAFTTALLFGTLGLFRVEFSLLYNTYYSDWPKFDVGDYYYWSPLPEVLAAVIPPVILLWLFFRVARIMSVFFVSLYYLSDRIFRN